MIDITDRDFDKEILECKLPIFVCFTTRCCHSCHPICLFADRLPKEYDGSVKFGRLDTEKSAEIAKRYLVTAVPTILLFQKFQEIKRLFGFKDEWSLRHLLNDVIDENESLIREP